MPLFDEYDPRVEGFGYSVVTTDPVSESELAHTYQEYRRTGGAPIRVWERRLRRLAREGKRDGVAA